MSELATRPCWEVADVFRRFGGAYNAANRMPANHQRVMQDIIDCRTAALGGHLEECDSCQHERPVYNSCRNRHCPKCMTMEKEKWLEARRSDLLPVNYFHQVFTMPHELNALTLANKKVIFDILFKAVSDTLLTFGKDPKGRFGGKVAFTLVLHTWNQKLLDHFHIHCIMPAGALRDDGTWVNAKYKNYLFPVNALAPVFRGKFISCIREAFEKNKLIFPGKLSDLSHPIRFEGLIESVANKNWHVYSKPPFGGPEKTLDYLGRYTHRVAISNHRIKDITDQSVTFAYRDRNDQNRKKLETLSGTEFVRRFLLHTLPRGFVRIRHYGILASRCKKENLEKCRQALNAKPPAKKDAPQTPEERLLKLTGIDVLACPCCKTGRMKKTRDLPKMKVTTKPQHQVFRDTS